MDRVKNKPLWYEHSLKYGFEPTSILVLLGLIAGEDHSTSFLCLENRCSVAIIDGYFE
jgi:hypothetical protein